MEVGDRHELGSSRTVSRRCCSCSPEPVSDGELARPARRARRGRRALDVLRSELADGRRGRRAAPGRRRLHARHRPRRRGRGRRLLSKPRTPPLTQAQAETLAIVAYLQPVSRPEIARIRGVNSESAVATLDERGLIEETGRSRFGAIIYRTTPLFEKLFGLAGLDELPDRRAFDPTPEDERELRERLLRAGEQRAS